MAKSLWAAAALAASMLVSGALAEPPAPATVTVIGKRPLHPCAEKETGCIAQVAERLWTEFPNQIETFCTGQIISKQRQRQLFADFLGEGGGISATIGDAAPLDDNLAPALAQICSRPKEHAWQPLAQTWALWTSVPGATEIGSAGGDKVGDARLYCRINQDGRLSRCTVSDESPTKRGLGSAALKLAGRFRAATNPRSTYDPAAAWVEVMVHFGPPATPRLIALPDWILVPNAVPLFPAAAQTAAVKSGAGRVDCGIGQDGGLTDCRLLDETPTGLGFGDAALAAAKGMRMNLWTRDGYPTPGGRVIVPLRFNAP